MASSIDKLMEISSRIDHLEQTAEWIARESVHTDNAISQSGTLICVIADELRSQICDLVQELERTAQEQELDEEFMDTIH